MTRLYSILNHNIVIATASSKTYLAYYGPARGQTFGLDCTCHDVEAKAHKLINLCEGDNERRSKMTIKTTLDLGTACKKTHGVADG